MSPTRGELVRATRARIIEAAARLTRERGPNGFSMDVLAKEAGVARATVYEHFRSKRALLDALASTISRSVQLDDTRNDSGDADPVAALAEMLGEVCRHWSEQEDRMRGLRTLTAVTGGDHSGERIDDGQLRRAVDALAAAGRLRAPWTVEDAVDALAALTSYSTYEQLRSAPRTPDQVEVVLRQLSAAFVGSP